MEKEKRRRGNIIKISRDIRDNNRRRRRRRTIRSNTFVKFISTMVNYLEQGYYKQQN